MKITLSESQFKELVRNATMSAIQESIINEDDWDDILNQALGSDPNAKKAMSAAQKDLGVKKKKSKKAEPTKDGFSATDDEIIDAMGDEEEVEDDEEDKEEKEEKSLFGKFVKSLSETLSEDDIEKFVAVCSDAYSAPYDDLMFAYNIFKTKGSGRLNSISQYNAIAKEITERANILSDVNDGGNVVYGYKVVDGKVEPSHPKVNYGGASFIPTSSSNFGN